MTRNTLSRTVTSTVLAAVVFSQVVSAATIFYDDFEDGNAEDEMPVTWVPDTFKHQEVEDGNLIIFDSTIYTGSIVDGLDLADTSIRTRLRLSRGDFIGVGVRNISMVGDPFSGYFAGVGADGEVKIVVSIEEIGNSPGLSTGLRPLEEDIMMQLDAIDGRVSLWAWPAGETRPVVPLLTRDDEFDRLATGDISVWAVNLEMGAMPVRGGFRFVRVADMSIPEPSTFTLAALAFLTVVCRVRRMRRV